MKIQYLFLSVLLSIGLAVSYSPSILAYSDLDLPEEECMAFFASDSEALGYRFDRFHKTCLIQYVHDWSDTDCAALIPGPWVTNLDVKLAMLRSALSCYEGYLEVMVV